MYIWQSYEIFLFLWYISTNDNQIFQGNWNFEIKLVLQTCLKIKTPKINTFKLFIQVLLKYVSSDSYQITVIFQKRHCWSETWSHIRCLDLILVISHNWLKHYTLQIDNSIKKLIDIYAHSNEHTCTMIYPGTHLSFFVLY